MFAANGYISCTFVARVRRNQAKVCLYNRLHHLATTSAICPSLSDNPRSKLFRSLIQPLPSYRDCPTVSARLNRSRSFVRFKALTISHSEHRQARSPPADSDFKGSPHLALMPSSTAFCAQLSHPSFPVILTFARPLAQSSDRLSGYLCLVCLSDRRIDYVADQAVLCEVRLSKLLNLNKSLRSHVWRTRAILVDAVLAGGRNDFTTRHRRDGQPSRAINRAITTHGCVAL